VDRRRPPLGRRVRKTTRDGFTSLQRLVEAGYVMREEETEAFIAGAAADRVGER